MKRVPRRMVIVIVAIAAGIAALAHTAPFEFLLDALYGDTAVWSVPQTTGQRTIYLTFDDGPNPVATAGLLDVLQEEQARATFFLIDAHVTGETVPLIRRMFQEGHGVALHSGDRWLMLHSPGRLAAELTSAAARIEQLAGSAPCPLFRPHAGWRSIPMFSGVRRAGYKLAGWSWLTFDWVGFRQRTGERVAAQVLSHAAPGKIVVMHDGHHRDPRPDRQYTIAAARRIIPALRAEGYEFGSLCDAAKYGDLAREESGPSATIGIRYGSEPDPYGHGGIAAHHDHGADRHHDQQRPLGRCELTPGRYACGYERPDGRHEHPD